MKKRIPSILLFSLLITSYINAQVSTGCPSDPITVTRIYEVIDAAGNPATCERVISIVDTQPPSLTCPGPLNAVCDISEILPYTDYAAFVVAGGSADDNCGIDEASFTWISDVSDGNSCPETVTRTYQIADNCGATSTCVQTILIDNTTPPIISCPADYMVSCFADIVVNANDATFTASCTSGNTLVADGPNLIGGDANCPGAIYEIEYTVTDNCGNTDNCSQFVSLASSDLVATCPADEVLACDAPLPAPNPSLVTTTNSCSDVNPVTVIHLSDASNGATNCAGDQEIIVRTYRATDACGNVQDCTQTFTYSADTEGPQVLACLSNQTGLSCGEIIPTPVTSVAAFEAAGGDIEDACTNDANISVSSSDSDNNALGCGVNVQVITRTYTFTDACGNESQCLQTFTYDADVTGPVVTCVPNITGLSCNDLVPAAVTTVAAFEGLGGIVTDGCSLDGEITVASSDVDNNALGCTGTPRIIERTYTLTDACGNPTQCVQQIIYDVDVTAPIVTCPPTNTTMICGQAVPDPYANITEFINAGGSVSDDCTNTNNLNITFLGSIETGNGCAGSPLIVTHEYEISDACNNVSTCTQNFQFQADTNVPEVTCPPIDNTLTCGDPLPVAATDATSFIALGGTITDNCTSGNNFTVSVISETDNASLGCSVNPFTVTRTYRIADECNNSISCEHIFIYQSDQTPPVVTCPPTDNTLNCGDPLPAPATDVNSFTALGGSVSDNCSATANVSVSVLSETDNNGLGCAGEPFIITRTYLIEDECGNFSTCSQAFEYLVDSSPIIVTCPPTDNSLECGESLPSPITNATDFVAAGGSLADNCYDPNTFTFTVLSETPNTGLGCIGDLYIVTRTYQIEDACGNVNTCDHIFEYQPDTSPPAVSCPPIDNTLTCGQTLPAAATDAASFIALGGTFISDNCTATADLIVTMINEDDNGTLGCVTSPYIVTRTYEITDECGNATTCDHVFQYQADITPPIVTCPPTDNTLTCGDPLPAPATDATSFAALGGSLADNCSTNANLTISVLEENNNNTLGCDIAPFTIVRTYEIVDECGNTTTCDHVFQFGTDATPPVVVCPPNDNTLTCGDALPLPANDAASFTALGGSLSDNCTGNVDLSVSVLSETNNGGIGCAGMPYIVTRTYIIEDLCGNFSTCDHVFEYLVDQTPLEVTCTSVNTELACGDALPDPFITATGFIAAGGSLSDNCSDPDSFTFTVLDEASTGTLGCSGNMLMVTRTYQIEDACGNTATCDHVFEYMPDITPPVITCPSVNNTLSCGQNLPAAATDAASFMDLGGTTLSDNCTTNENLIITVLGETDNNTLGCTNTPFIVTRTYQVEDECGNTATCDHIFQYQADITPPTVNCPPTDNTLICGDALPAAATDAASFIALGGTVSDNCSDNVNLTISVLSETDNNTLGCAVSPFTIIRTYQITDECGNATTCNHIFLYQADQTPPVATCPPTDNTLTCGDALPAPANSASALIALGGTVSDNCNALNELTVSVLSENDNDGIGCAGEPFVVTRTYLIEDVCGNFTTCDHVFDYLIDETPLTITCPPTNTDLECGDGLPAPVTNAIDFMAIGGTVSDNCSDPMSFIFTVISETSNNAQGCLGDLLVITRTYQIEDECGNIATCDHLFEYQPDTTPPAVSCPSIDNTLTCGQDLPAAATDAASFIALGGTFLSDNCTVTEDLLVAVINESDNGTLGCVGSPLIVTRTYEITDECGNATTCNHVFQYQPDITPPTVSCPPTDNTLTCGDALPVPATDAASFIALGGAVSDNCSENTNLIISVLEESSNNTLGCDIAPFTIVRTYEIVDECGNTSTCDHLFQFGTDATPPVVTCPPTDNTLNCGDTLPASATDAASFVALGGTVSDNCTGNVDLSVSVLSETNNGGIGCTGMPYIVTRTYIVEDLCGNFSTCDHIFEYLVDQTPLEVTCTSVNTSLECGDPLPEPFITATEFIAAGGSLSDNCSDPDSFTFTVLNESSTGTLGCSGDMLVVTRTYQIEDACGNTATCDHVFEYQPDTTPPVMKCPPVNSTLSCGQDLPAATTDAMSFMALGGTTLSDNCTSMENLIISVVNETNNNTLGCTDAPFIVTRTYQIEDECGNTATCDHIFQYQTDITPPTVDCPPTDNTLICGDALPAPATDVASFIALGGAVSDNCSENDNLTITILSETDNNTLGCAISPFTVLRTYQVTDECGNATTCDHLFEYQADETAPVVTCPPTDNTLTCGEPLPAPANSASALIALGGTVSDNCNALNELTVSVLSEENNGGIGCAGEPYVVTRTYLIEDVCGNFATCDHIFDYIIDQTPLTITCPPTNTDLQCGDDLPDPVTNAIDFMAMGGTVSDNCSDPMSFVFTVVSETPNTAQGCTGDLFIVTRTYQIEDECGNTATCDHVFEYQADTTPPVMKCPPVNSTLTCGQDLPAAATDAMSFMALGGTTLSDNCTSMENLIISVVNETNNNTLGCTDAPYIVTRTYQVEDECGNIATCDQMFQYQTDITPPTVNCPPTDNTLICGDALPAPATDAASFIALGGAVSDNCSENDNLTIIVLNETDNNTLGCAISPFTVLRTYQITDECGNITTCEHLFEYQADETAPVVTCPPIDNTLACGEPLPAPANSASALIALGGTVSDNCNALNELMVSVLSENDNGNTGCTNSPLIITRIYLIEDVCGNTNTCEHIFEFQSDSEAPSITCPLDELTMDCGVSPPPGATDASAFLSIGGGITDNCSDNDDITVSFIDDFTINDVCPLGSENVIIRTYTISDACGNEVECSQQFIYTNPISELAFDKTLIAGPSLNVDGTYDFTFGFFIENTGNLNISNLQITDNLTVYSPVNSIDINSITSNLSENILYDGINNTNTLTGTDDFTPGESGSFAIEINVGPYDLAPSDLINIAIAEGIDPNGDTLIVNDTVPTPLNELIPELSIIKQVTNGPELNTNGTYDITFGIRIQNTGNVVLDSIQVIDNLLDYAPINSADVINTSANLSPNGTYNGLTNSNTLTGFDVLTPGAIGTFEIITNVGPYNSIPENLVNTAIVTGIDPTGDPISQNDTIDTPLEVVMPGLSLDKQLIDGPSLLIDGTYNITFAFKVQNTGDIVIDSLQIFDNLVDFAPVNSSTFDNVSANLSTNNTYNGISDSSMLTGFDDLTPGELGFFDLVINVGPYDSIPSDLQNVAIVVGDGPTGDPIEYTDSIPATILPPNPAILVDKQITNGPTLNTNGTYDITFGIFVQNTGNVELDSIQLSDNLIEFAPINTVSLNNVSANLSSNGAFNGISNTNTLLGFDHLIPGESGFYDIVVNVGPYDNIPTDLQNAIEASGEDPNGQLVEDTDTVDTSLEALTPALQITKQVLSGPTLNSDGTYDVTFGVLLQNTGNTDLDSIQVTDDLTEFAPLNNVSLTSISANLSPNSSYNGLSNINTLLGIDHFTPGETGFFNLTINSGPYNTTPEDLVNLIDITGNNPIGEPITDNDTAAVPLEDLIPSLELIKTISDGPILLADGTYNITFAFQIQNTGNVTLDSLQVNDDLSEFAPINFANINNPSSNLSPNNGFNGISNTAILNGYDVFTPNEIGTFNIIVNVGPFEVIPEDLVNAAIALGDDPTGESVEETDTIDVPLEEQMPQLILDKQLVEGPSLNTDGTYDITFGLFIQNGGDVLLDSIQITDDLTVFAPVNSTLITNISSNLSSNGSYNGLSNINTLLGFDELNPGEAGTFNIEINVGPYANTPIDLENIAIGTGDDPTGEPISTIDTVDTPLDELIAELTLIKNLTEGPVLNPNGTYTASFNIFVENTGTVLLDTLKLSDNLSEFTPVNNITIFNQSNNFSTNSAFDGITDTNLLIGLHSLLPGQSGFVDFEVNFGPYNNIPTDLNNAAIAVADDPIGNPVEENDSTEVPLDPINPELIVTKQIIEGPNLNTDGTYDLTFGLFVQNTGNVILDSIQISDNLLEFTPVNSTSFNNVSSNLSTNNAFDGINDINTLNGTNQLHPGETGALDLTLNVGPYTETPSDLENGIIAMGIDPIGNPLEETDTIEVPLEMPNPELLVTKQIIEGPSLNADGTYDITFGLFIQNTGNVVLDNVQLSDDLTEFAPINSTSYNNVSSNLSTNNAFNGISNINTLTGSEDLIPGETGSLDLIINVGPYETLPNDLLNGVTAIGTDPTGDIVEETDTTEVPLEIPNPSIVITKNIIDGPSLNTDGTYDITFTLFVQNTGNITLTNVQITDDLTDFFPINSTTFANVSNNINTNGSFDGINNINTLLGADVLTPGETASLDLIINIGPYESIPSDLENTAIVKGDDPNGETITDEDDIATPLEEVIAELEAIKTVSQEPVLNTDGTYTVGFNILVENTGNVALNNVQLTDDLAAFTPVNNVQIINSSTNLNTDFNFDGANNSQLLLGNDDLNPQETGFVTLELNVGPYNPADTTLYNQVTATGINPTGEITEDLSDYPDDLTSSDDPTPTYYPETNPSIGIAKALINQEYTDNNTALLTFQLYVENTGDVTLNNLQLQDDLETQFGPLGTAYYMPWEILPNITSSSASQNPTLNFGFNGSSNINLLAGNDGILEPGQNYTIVFTMEVEPLEVNTPLENIAIASGNDPNGDYVEDTSQDGFDPDPNNNGPEDNSIPTPVVLEFADLGVVKSSDAVFGAINVGDTITYTIKFRNHGPNDVDYAEVTDYLPTGVTYLSHNASIGTYNPALGIWEINETFAAFDLATLSISAIVKSPGEIINTATVTDSSLPDPNPDNNEDNEIVEGLETDLTIIKTVSNETPNLGDTITYYLEVNNLGPSFANNIQVTDMLPNGVTYLSTIDPSYDPNNGDFTFDLGSLAVGYSMTVEIRAIVEVANESITNNATVQSDLPDPNPDNNEDEVSIIGQTADLAVFKIVDNPNPNYGEEVTFTIELTNNGPSTATNIEVLEELPFGLTYVSHSESDGSYNSTTNLWTIPSLNNGSSETLILTAIASEVGELTNVVSIVGSDQPDLNPNNNQGDATVEVKAADLGIEKVSNVEMAAPGDTVQYTITLTNYGPSEAGDIEVTDYLPFGLQYLSYQSSQGSYNGGSGIWQIGSLSANNSVTLQINALLTVNGDITNIATITNSDTYDPNPNNNEDEVEIIVQEPIADLELIKTADKDSVTIGDTIIYTIAVSNNGPDEATNIIVNDVLPEETLCVSSSDESYDPYNGDFTWNIEELAVGETDSLVIQVIAQESGPVINTATIESSDQFDPNLENNSDGVKTIVTGPMADLQLQKLSNTSEVNIGEMISYTIVISNLGPDDSEAIEVADYLPTGLSYSSNTTSTGFYNTGTGIWNLPYLGINESDTLILNAIAEESGIIINNAAIVSTEIPDPNLDNNQDSAEIISIEPMADLEIIKTVEDTIGYTLGDTITYILTLFNNGPDEATNIEVTDLLPDEVTYVASSDESYDPYSGDFTWNIGGPLAASGSVLLAIDVIAEEEGNIVNIAAITASDQTDPNEANNTDGTMTTVTNPTIDLAITKEVSMESVQLGMPFWYTITIMNNGPDEATNIEVMENLPVELNYTGHLESTGIYNISTGIWAISTLDAGESATLTLDAEGFEAGTFINTAMLLSVDQEDTNSDNNSDNVPVDIYDPTADLEIIKTVEEAEYTLGDTITYTLTLVNKGPDEASNIEVTDYLPEEVTYITSNDASYNPIEGDFTWNITGPLEANNSVVLTIQALAEDIGTITNIATITGSDQTDPNEENNTDGTSTTVVNPTIDLAITKDVSLESVHIDTPFSYTITLINNGPDEATKIEILEDLPTGLSYIDHLETLGMYNPANGIWTIPALAPGESTTLTLEVEGTETGSFVNTAMVLSSAEEDTNPDNNSDNVPVDIYDSIADLEIIKTIEDTIGHTLGDTITYILTLLNHGPYEATNIEVTDLLPEEVSYINASDSSYDPFSGDFTWNVGGPLAASGSVMLVIDVLAEDIGNITNIATITGSDQTDPNEENNIDGTMTTVVNPTIDLAIIKEVSMESVHIGTPFSYTITLTNNGPDGATKIEVLEDLPIGLNYIDHLEASGMYNPANGIWTIPILAAGESTTLILEAEGIETGSFVNTATVLSSNEEDTNPDNNSDNVSVDIYDSTADLAIIKTVAETEYTLGDTITYTLTLANNGPYQATNIEVTDYLPEEVTYIAASDGSYDPLNGDFTWNINGPLAADNSVALSIQAIAEETGSITNIASITGSDQTDPNEENNTDGTSTIVLDPTIDIAVIKEASSEVININTPFWYTITITNNGPDLASNIEIVENLPNGLDYIAHIEASGVYNISTGLWSIPTLAVGESTTLTIDVEGTEFGIFTNTATFLSANQEDANPDNNSDNVAVDIYEPMADLVLIKSIDTTCAIVGDTIVYTLTVINNGPDPTSNIEVSDYLPTAVTCVASSDESYNPYTGDAIWNIEGTLSVGDTAQLQIYTIANEIGSIYNQAVIEYSEVLDPNQGNNISGVKSDIKAPETDLEITKTVSSETVHLGYPFWYTITLTNNGPEPATNIQVVDNLPVGLTYLGHLESVGIYNSATGVWSVPSLAVGESVTLTLDAEGIETGWFTNTASILSADQDDINPDNNTDSAEVYLYEATVDLEIIKTVEDTIGYTLGDTITYILTLMNHGPYDATNIEVSDYLPEGVTYVSSSDETYDPYTGDFTWNIGGPLAASGSVLLAIDVIADEVGDILNIATITGSDQLDTNGANNTDGITVFVSEPVIDLEITKTVSSDTVNIDEEFWYTITLTNNGPAPATNIEVIENLPTGLVYTGHIETEGIYSAANATWHVPLLEVGQSAKLIIDAEGFDVGWFYNSVTILSADQEDTNPNNNEAGAEVYVYQPLADLALIKSIDTTCAVLGDTIIYTLTVINNGPDTVSNIGVSDYLPTQVLCVGTSDETYDPYTGDMIWNIDTPLAPNDSTELTIYTLANEIGSIYNQAVIEFSGLPDSVDGNNISGVKSDIKAPETDLAIFKTVSTEKAEPNEPFTYFIELVNVGPHAASNIQVVENLPPGIDYIGHNESNGVYNIANGLWNISSLQVGDTALLMIDVSSPSSGTYTNVATILSADQEDTNPNNNSSEVPILINTPPSCEGEYVEIACEEVNINVLTNDFDLDGDPITICDYSEVTHGSIELTDSGFVYTPPYVEYYGLIDFSYTICDPYGDQCTSKVFIQLDCDPNDPPVCVDDVYENECTIMSLPVLVNDYDPDGDQMTICEHTYPAHGTLTETAIGFTYTPNGDYAGLDSFSYTVCDPEGEECTSTVSIQVNCAICETEPIHACVDPVTPIIICPEWCFGDDVEVTDVHTTFDCSLEILEGGCISYIGLPLFNGPEEIEITGCADGYCETVMAYLQVGGCCEPEPIYECVDPITPITVCPEWCFDGTPEITDMHTTFDCSLTDEGNGCITYIGLPGFTGEDEILITGCYNGNCETTTAYINVGGCCEPQPIYECTEPLTPLIVCPDWCLEGDLQISEMHTTFDCSLVDLGNGCFRYTPLPAFIGDEEVQITACVDGECESTIAYIEVGNCNENTPPIAINDFDSSDGSPITIAVILNDNDPDGDELTVCDYTEPSNGTVVLEGNEFIYTPNDGFQGVETFTYTICDGNGGTDEATVTITVEHCITDQTVCVPMFVNPSIPTEVCIDFCSLNENVSVQSLTTNSLNCMIELGTGTCFTILPVPQFQGEVIASLTACDDESNCEMANIYITVGDCGVPVYTNQIPVAINDTIYGGSDDNYLEIDVLNNDHDSPESVLEICDYTSPANGSITIVEGMIHYEANSGFAGTDAFAYSICDEYGATATAMVLIVIDEERLEDELARAEQSYCHPIVPNPITPNGDFARTLTINVGAECLANVNKAQLFVYDVNGRTLYEQLSDDVSTLEWDAKVNKQVVPTGMYVYELKCYTPQGIQRFTGLIQVAR